MTGPRVFGMGDEPTAAPTWPPLTEDEVSRAVAATWGGPEPAGIEWHSARPLSSTVGVRLRDGARVVVKRLPLNLRDLAALAEEHRFMAHLRAAGIPVPDVRATPGIRSVGVRAAESAPDPHPDDIAPGAGGRPRKRQARPAAESRVAASVRRGPGFVYEVHRAGVGEDRYRTDFSWTPYRAPGDATAAGAMLARMHLAAAGFDAPARPARPLVASLHGEDVVRAVEWHIARRPAVARFLADRDWRTEIPYLRVDLAGVRPLWTHGDWHATNLLWDGGEVTSVFDFGLADRTTAVFDLATAIERAAVEWVSLRDGGAAHVRADQVRALIDGYRSERPLAPAEQAVLAELLPVVHLGYELSEIDYFLTVADEPRNAEIAYQDWLLGHLSWFRTAAGRDLCALVRDLAAG
ncbi:phosphotransferase enzyme family protein [Nocardia canadensis]|uniref:phosphotransferase enzyme family protein n=1 Tax=Nocardia canadensis TaxID=3065238 RepID=UPI00292F329D|nr:phosphotransferase [Nocardia canadensis]